MDEHLVWLGEDHAAASREGWDLFECSGSDHGDLQLQRFDCPDEVECAPTPYPFATDTDVWRHVRARAEGGSALHRKALAILRSANPDEFQRITTT
ncbi:MULTISPECIES: hypothetical protein [Mycolicibacterium]|uniref:hypothetical protein n=1 Tax=Mycolicibacterium TaxID=1866885 RepID=UPI001CDD81C2|nr:hypothetical protein [Mycolicibacterium fortuitum]UBV20370.1 hypothetical protein H8Z59_24340 [Mycolicibacterium fortuitum]